MAVKSLRKSASSESDLAGALHEVSNALTVVLGFLADAKGKVPKGKVSEAIEVAYSHAYRGHRVAREAIGAEIEAAESVRSAMAVAADAVQAAEREASRRGVRLVIEQSEPDAMLEGGPSALQILVNLLLNAVSFSPPSATVRLTYKVDGDVVFRVIDEGPGVPKDHRASLFQPGGSMRPGGAGVGLSHSSNIAVRYGGSLRLIPSASGACFELNWPVTEAPSRTIQRAPASRREVRGMRVLLLEDDADVSQMVQFGLEARGAEVSTASSEQELRALVDGGRHFDAALVDLSPIQGNALGALEHLAAKHVGLPIILISGSALAPDPRLPLSGWVQKPFEVGEVFEALAELPPSANTG